MNPESTRTAVFEDEIDLLVDGELPEEDRARLLRRLDDENEWQRCALAFLEAQAWREAMIQDAPARRELVGRTARRLLPVPLAAAAAAILGFVSALLFLKPAGPVIVQGDPPAVETPAPEVRLVPYPVVERRGFIPASDEQGQFYYRTREDVPPAVLKALVLAGHDVQRVKRTIDVPRENDSPLQLPITETRVFINHEL